MYGADGGVLNQTTALDMLLAQFHSCRYEISPVEQGSDPIPKQLVIP